MKRVVHLVANDGGTKVDLRVSVDSGQIVISRAEIEKQRSALIRTMFDALSQVKYADFGVDNIRMVK